jgi:antitoxin VapB
LLRHGYLSYVSGYLIEISIALFIRDETVDRLASDVQRALKTSTKKEAVLLALQHQLEQASRKRPLMEAIAELQAKAAALGRVDSWDSQR